MVAKWCARMTQFDGFFVKDAILVPIPSHHPTKPKSLWVPEVLAVSLKQCGLGYGVVPCLERTEIVRQSSRSASQDRPAIATHYKTLRIKDRIATEPPDILLVDDVIARGTSIAAACIRMAEAYPNARIKAFAAMNTRFPGEFGGIIDPHTGAIDPGKPYPEKRLDD